MAVVNTKSKAVAGADTSPPNPDQMVNLKVGGGRIKESVGTVEAASGDSATSTYRLARVHSSVRISQLLLSCDAITAGVVDLGVYETAANGGAAVDSDVFGSGQSIAAALAGESVYGVDIADIEKPLWEVLGKTKDPGRLYDIAATVTTAPTAAGTVSLAVRFVDGN